MPILARTDSAGASHDFVDAARELEILFSVGFDLTEPVREAILARPGSAWLPALKQDGQEREGAGVCELVDLDLEGWPSGTRAICRRERPHPGAQLSFTDHNGYRFQCFITDQTDSDVAALEARHRAHARVEDRIRCAKDTGLDNFPSGALPPTRSGWSWCSPPRTCSSSTSVSAWRARHRTGSPRSSAIGFCIPSAA
jgi:hypothetical protein